MHVLQVAGGGHEDILDFHNRQKHQVLQGPGLCHQSDINLLLLHHGQCAGGRLAFDGDFDVGVLLNEPF